MPHPYHYTGGYGQGYGSIRIRHDTNRHNSLKTNEEHWAEVAMNLVVNYLAYGEPSIEWAQGLISGAEGNPPGDMHHED